jgi:hypothetical protein
VRENFELWWQGGAYLLFRNKWITLPITFHDEAAMALASTRE